jgi:hypothetical protein
VIHANRRPGNIFQRKVRWPSILRSRGLKDMIPARAFTRRKSDDSVITGASQPHLPHLGRRRRENSEPPAHGTGGWKHEACQPSWSSMRRALASIRFSPADKP